MLAVVIILNVMSETVHYKGVAIKIESDSIEDLQEFAKNELILRNKEVADYYKGNFIECLCDKYDEEFFFHPSTKKLYEITVETVDQDDEIIKASLMENGNISYELRFYNGGAGFAECLEEAIDKL